MKHVLCALLVVSLAAPATSAFAADNGTTTVPVKSASMAQPTPVPTTFRASVERAIETADLTQFSSVPQAPRPRSGDGRALRQMGAGGGSKMGMIVGLVSAAAGVGLTVYMVKAMKDSTGNANNAQ
jgi:hypothetical protein